MVGMGGFGEEGDRYMHTELDILRWDDNYEIVHHLVSHFLSLGSINTPLPVIFLSFLHMLFSLVGT